MNKTTQENTHLKIEDIFNRFITLLAALIVTCLGIAALFHTIIFPLDYSEKPTNSLKYSIAGTVGFFILAGAAYYTGKHLKFKRLPSLKTFYRIQTYTALFIGLTWLSIATTSPVADQGTSITLSIWLQNNDLGNLHANDYLQQYPFQSGYILFCTLMGQLFGMNNMLPIRLFNLLMIIVSLKTLCKITERMFKNDAVTKTTIVLSTAFLPLILFATFIYGNIPSLAFCLLACLLQMAAIQASDDIRKRLAYGTLSAACLFVALWFKPNSLIFLIGIELIWLVILFAHKRVLVITFIILGAVAYIAASAIPIFLMGSRINVPLDNPTPKTAWIAMGLQESRDRAPGWYNNYVVNIYKEAPHDNNQVDAMAKEAIAQRIQAFTQDPLYAAHFFTRKVATTWAEPTFQSLWISYGGTGGERADLTQSKLEHEIMRGGLHAIYIVYCDIIQNIIYIGASYCLIFRWRGLTTKQITLIVIFLGGFTFHLFWETKSDYVLPYFLLLIPYAAAGWHDTIFTNRKMIYSQLKVQSK